MATPTRLCSRCGAALLPHSEKCPNCGKDSKYGTQMTSLIVVTCFLLAFPLLVVVLMVLFLRP